MEPPLAPDKSRPKRRGMRHQWTDGSGRSCLLPPAMGHHFSSRNFFTSPSSAWMLTPLKTADDRLVVL